MENFTIDVDLIDEGGENPFEQIMRYIEKAKLSGQMGQEESKLEKKILALERTLVDLSDAEDSGSRNLANDTVKLVSEYAKILTNSMQPDAFGLTFQGIDKIEKTINKVGFSNYKEASKIISSLSIKNFLKKRNQTKTSIEEMFKVAIINLTKFDIYFSDSFESEKHIWKKKFYDEWEIEFNFKTSEQENHKPLEFIYQFIEILNQIDGVQVVLEEIKLGSLKARLKAVYDSATSKDEVKELLESSKKFAKGKLEKEYEETENLKAQTEKIDIEKKLLEKELEEKDSIDSAYLKALDIRKKEEELRRMKLENNMLQLQYMKESTQALAEMLAKGYISQTHFNMLIKGIPFLKVEGSQLVIGESTDVIDEM